jgi:hypothetical protein
LAALVALFACGFAQAQRQPMPMPPVPTFSTAAAEQVVMQPPKPPDAAADSVSKAYENLLTLPGPERLFRLESEEAFKIRMQNAANDLQRGERLEFPKAQVLAKGHYAGRAWPESHCVTEPNYVCYQKLLFEQKNFERYGWDLGPITPALSAFTFYTDFWFVPYRLALDPFRCYECSAGYCMPGDPVPLMLYPPEMSGAGLLAEAGSILALVAIFP